MRLNLLNGFQTSLLMKNILPAIAVFVLAQIADSEGSLPI